MTLLVDIGNSSIAWAMLGEDGLSAGGSVLHSGKPTKALWDKLWPKLAPPRVVVASVAAPAMAAHLKSWVARHWGIEMELITSQASALGVRNAYAEAACLGGDRWASLLAAHAQYPGRPVCIVDCGSAITIDAVDVTGQHLGGLIAPGIAMMRDSLLTGTGTIADALRPAEAGERRLLGTDTRSGIEGGTLYAAVAFVDRVAADLRDEMGGELACVLTGGDAPQILPLLSGTFDHVPQLVLQGLALLATGGELEADA